MSVKAQVAAGVRWTSLATLFRVLFLLARLGVLTRLLSPHDFGLMSLVTLILGYAQTYVELGFSNAIIQKQSSTPTQLSTLFWLNTIAGGIVALAVVALRAPAADLFHAPELATLLLPSALIFPLAALEQQFRALFTREMDFRRIAIAQITAELAGLVVAILAARQGAGAMSLVYAYIISATIRAGCMFIPGVQRWPIHLYFRLGEVKGHVRFGSFQLLQYTLSYFTANLDTIVIGRYLGTDILGLYTLAMRLIRLPQRHLSPMLARVAMPAFAKQQHNLPALKSGLLKIQRALAYATLPMLVGAFLTRSDLVPVLYGAERTELAPVVAILVWPGMFQALTGSMGAVHLALGRVRFLFLWAVSSLAVWAPTMYFGAQTGFEALLYLRLVMGSFLSVLFAWLTFGTVEASLKDSGLSISRPLACTAAMSLVVYLVSLSTGQHPSAMALTLQVSAGAIAFSAAAWIIDRQFVVETLSLLVRARSP